MDEILDTYGFWRQEGFNPDSVYADRFRKLLRPFAELDVEVFNGVMRELQKSLSYGVANQRPIKSKDISTIIFVSQAPTKNLKECIRILG